MKDISLDLEGMEYTSPAGLRVMLIVYKMYKQLDQDHFRLLHANDTMRAILRDTGFDQVLA